MNLKVGMLVKTYDNKIGEVKSIQNRVVAIRLKGDNGRIIYLNLKQVKGI